MQKVTITSVTVAAKKFLFCMRDFVVDSDIGTGSFLLVLMILHM